LIREFKLFLLANTNILQNNSSLTFQQAANQPAHTEPAKRAQIRWNEQWERRHWIQWINKPEESTRDSCDPYSGECQHDEKDCNDNDACTNDFCSPS